MDGSPGSSNAPAPFLVKTYDMVDDWSTNSLVSWSQTGCSFIVFNPTEFSMELLPKYFKHNNFSSFVRQLNTYGFRKVDPDQWEFANEEFIRGQKHLLTNIHRRKPIHSHSLQNQGNFSTPLSETEKQQYEVDIRRLRHDKSLLELELEMHERENQGFELQRKLLCERMQSLESRQRQLMVSLAQLIEKPGFAYTLMQQPGTYNKKRRMMNPNHYYEESNSEGNLGFTYEKENLGAISFPTENLELIRKLESSLNFWEHFLHGVDEVSGNEVRGSGVLSQPSPAIVTELHPDMTGQPRLLTSHPSSPLSRDTRSSPELEGSKARADSPVTPVISTLCLNADSGRKYSGIDVNSEPISVPEFEVSEERGVGIAVQAGANDLFWEQFLTETPGSRDIQKVESEKRETESRMSDSKAADGRKFWWKANDVSNLTERHGTSLQLKEHTVS